MRAQWALGLASVHVRCVRRRELRFGDLTGHAELLERFTGGDRTGRVSRPRHLRDGRWPLVLGTLRGEASADP